MNDRVFRAGVFRFSAAPKVHKAVQAVILIRSAGSLCAVYSSLVEMQGQQVGDAVASAVGAERCWADVLMDREINRGPDQCNLRLRGKKGQRYQMCRNTKSKFNDPTVAHGCLLIS